LVLAAVVSLVAGTAPAADAPAAAAPKREPLFRLEPGGPSSTITAMAFGKDGDTLYAAGHDKIVRVWRHKGEEWEMDNVAYRVPMGPGERGSIYALALSPDGKWLAVGGQMMARGQTGLRDAGMVILRAGLTDEQWQDIGAVHVFNTQDQSVRVLRGHRGFVLGLAFAPPQRGQPPVLISAAREKVPGEARYFGKVMAWDVDAGRRLGEATARSSFPTLTTPAITVGRPSGQPEKIRVALAWGDGQLLLWEPGKEPVAQPDGSGNHTAAFLPGAEALVTTSFRTAKQVRKDTGERLQEWVLSPEGLPSPGEYLAFPPSHNGTLLVADEVKALTLCSSRPGGPADLAALLVSVEKDGVQDYHLRLIQLARPFRVLRDVELHWGRHNVVPVLAAVPGGRDLAVSGRVEDHPIALYPIAQFLGDRAAPVLLRSVGTTMHYAAFVKKGEQAGLLLNEAEEATRDGRPIDPWLGALIYDLKDRSLVTDRKGWELDEAAAAGWSRDRARIVGTGKDARKVIVVRQDAAEKGRVELDPTSDVHASAVLAPRPPVGVPILAVAWSLPLDGETIRLYNGLTGEEVRRLTGHTAPVHSLVFSGNGRLLVSAAADQTVCVWSLASLAEYVGKVGQVPGLAVVGRNGPQAPPALEVAEVQAGSPAQGKLEVHDVVEAVTLAGGQPLQPTSALAFAEAVWLAKPGSTVTLTVRTGQGQPRQVPLAVSQGADDRNPLFTLFVTRDQQGKVREWIGWNPNGPYDSGAPQTERLLGWQFNPTDPTNPTGGFASADQYRKEYRREGILPYLAAEGNLKRGLDAWKKAQPPAPAPRMGLWINEGKNVGPDPKRKDAAGYIVVRDPKATLKVSVRDFAIEDVQSLTWQLDDGQAFEFAPRPGRERQDDLSRALRQPGLHKVRVVLQTREDVPRQVVQDLLVRYQPPAPTIGKLPEFQEVKQAPFRLRAKVEPEKNVKVTVIQRQGGKGVVEKEVGPDIDEELQLLPGDNDILIVAENRDALRGYEDEERTRAHLTVRFTPPEVPVAPPRIEVTVRDAAGPQPLQNGSLVVHVPKVRLVAEITGEENLADATLARAGGQPQPLKGFTSGEGKRFKFDQEVELDPAREVTFRFQAKTPKSAESVQEVRLDYRPLPPTVELLPPERPLHEGEGKPEARLTGLVKPPADGNTVEYQARVLVDGKPSDTAHVKEADGKLSVTAAIPRQRETSVSVELSNAREQKTVSDPVVIQYLRTPRNLELRQPNVGDSAAVDVTGTVESPLKLTGVRAQIEGEKGGPRDLTGAEFKQAQGDTWTIHLPNVGLEPGKSTIRVWASNADGEGPKPGTVVVNYQPPPRRPAPPAVEFTDPRGDLSVVAATKHIRFRVTSAAPLQKVELVRETVPPVHVPFPVAGLQPKAQGYYEFEKDVDLALGMNPLSVTAVNAGGEDRKGVMVTRVEEPVRVVVESVKVGGGTAQVLDPQVQPDGRPQFAEAAKAGVVRISGRVKWQPGTKPGEQAQAHVYVNGFQQVPVDLEPARDGTTDKTFSATVLLNKDKNDVVVEVPELKQDAGTRQGFSLGCEKPVAQQRWHVLVVGVGKEQKPEALRDEVLKHLKAEAVDEEHFKRPGVAEGYLYGPLTGADATPDKINTQLLLMKSRIEQTAGAGDANDVVLVYYRGAEEIQAAGHFFLTSLSGKGSDPQRDALSCDDLRQQLDDTLGAEVLLLDVAGSRTASRSMDRVVGWPKDPHVGVFRYSWRGILERPADFGFGNLEEAVTPDMLRSLVKGAAQYKDYLFLDYYLPRQLPGFIVNPRQGGGSR
jgi:WD40 repeat protein